jgi:D-lactate dehydrogenase
MKIAFFDTHHFERAAFDLAKVGTDHVLEYLEPRLTAQTARLR